MIRWQFPHPTTATLPQQATVLLDAFRFHWYNLFQQMMKQSTVVKSTRQEEIEQSAAQALLRCLQDIPSLSVEVEAEAQLDDKLRADIVAHVKSPTWERLLIAEVKASGQPAVARGAVDQLFRYTSGLPGSYGVFMAPYVSPRAAEICAEAGVGYADIAGNCRLAFDGIYIRIEGNPNPKAEKRDLRSLYSPKAERVLRVLLTHPRRRWKLQELAGEAQVSIGQAHNVKALLDAREWLQAQPEGFSLSDPAALLSEWAQNYRYRRSPAREFYSMKSPAEIEADLARAGEEEAIQYALTGFSGAVRLAPFVRYQRVSAYVAGPSDAIAQRLNLKEVSSGANVTLLTPYDEGVFYGAQQVGSDRVVSAAQCYLDVRSMAARGEEAAEVLLERVIKPTW